MKGYLFIVVTLILSLAFISSAECNADLSNAANSCTVSNSLTLNGTYSVSINGTSTTVGAIQINADNIIFDCNNTEIYGNWSQTGNNGFMGIYINTKNNITIQNCKVRNYNYGIRLRLDNNTNIINSNITGNRMGVWFSQNNTDILLSGNSFFNDTYAGVWFQDYNGSDITIYNNTFYDQADGIREESLNSNVTTINITSNTFHQNYSSTNIRPAILQIGGSNWKVNQNTVYGSATAFSYGIDFRGQNNTAERNYLYKTQYALSCSGCYNFTMTNNTIDLCDENLFLNGKNIYSYNNTFKNMTLNIDGYNLGINIYNSSNVLSSGDNFSKIATAGINAQGSINVTILNPIFDFISLSERTTYSANDGYEPRCAIKLLKYYKGYIPTTIQINGNDNVSISGGTYDSDTPCYLHTENVTNLNHDLTNYWFKSFESPQGIFGKMDFYVPNYEPNLSRYSPIQGIRYDMWNYLGGSTTYLNYSISQNKSYFHNFNTTNSFNIILYNLSNAKTNYSNGTNICTSCSGSYTVNLTPLNNISVYYEYTNPIITIVNPDSDETATPTLLSITTNELCSCNYSLNSGTNSSMTTSDYLSFLSSLTLNDGSYSLLFSCEDEYGNTASSSSSFRKSTISNYLGGSSSETETTTEVTNVTNQTLTSLESQTKTDLLIDNIKKNLDWIYHQSWFYIFLGILIVVLLLYFGKKY